MAVALRERTERDPAPARRAQRLTEVAVVCRRLEGSLRRGQERIQAARATGDDVANLELRWREMLRSYERLSQLLARCPSSPRS